MQSEVESEKRLMVDAYSWPLYPFLPVKKSSKEIGKWPICAVITVSDENNYKAVPTIYEQSIDDIAHSGKFDSSRVIKKFNSFDELIADGWVVD